MSAVTSKMTALVEENTEGQRPSLGPLHLYKATSSPEEPRQLPQNPFFNKIAAAAAADPPEQGGGDTTDILSKRIQALEGRLGQTHTHLMSQETPFKARILVLEERVSAAERRLLQQQSQSSALFVSSNVNNAQQIDLNTLTAQSINHPTTHFTPLFKAFNTLQDHTFKKGPASFISKKDHQSWERCLYRVRHPMLRFSRCATITACSTQRSTITIGTGPHNGVGIILTLLQKHYHRQHQM